MSETRARSMGASCAALLLVACGGGGGPTGSSVPSAQFASGASHSPETSGSVTVEVELTVPGLTLEEDLEFFVSDEGTGTALAGSDYVPLGALTLTFPAGAQSGDRLSISWTPMDDGSLEGNETLDLALEPIGDAVVAGRRAITATILDDESSTLVVAEGSVTGDLVFPGGSVPMGNQTVGVPTTTGIDLWLDNIGAFPLRISAPTLVAGNVADFVIETPVEIAASATVATNPVEVTSPFFVPGGASSGSSDSLPLFVSTALLDELERHDHVLLRGTPVPGAPPIDLELERVPRPFRSDAVLVIDGVPVAGGLEAVASRVTAWSGHVVGDEGAQVFLALSESSARGWIRSSSTDADPLHLLAGSAPGAPSTLIRHSAMSTGGAPPPANLCSGVREVPGREQGLVTAAATTDGGAHVPYVCRLALETDYQLYSMFGDATALTNWVTDLVAAVSDRYHADVATTLEIAYLGIHTTPADPWSSQDGGGSVEDLLYEFQAAWAPALGGSWPAGADLAHFLSGGLGGGLSFIDVLCDPDYGFGVSSGLTASTDWSTYTGGTSALYWDFDVLAHELGHAFNARHTHEYCPPLDTCALSCHGQLCGRGTIMSYCHACPGGVANVDLEFHPQIANEMRLAVNRSCLSRATLASGDATFFRLFFRPSGSPGPRSATLEFTHDAASAPSPYRIHLIGTAE